MSTSTSTEECPYCGNYVDVFVTPPDGWLHEGGFWTHDTCYWAQAACVMAFFVGLYQAESKAWEENCKVWEGWWLRGP